MTGLEHGAPGPEASIGKLAWARWHRDLGELAMDIRGAAGTVTGPEYGLDEWQRLWLVSRRAPLSRGLRSGPAGTVTSASWPWTYAARRAPSPVPNTGSTNGSGCGCSAAPTPSTADPRRHSRNKMLKGLSARRRSRGRG